MNVYDFDQTIYDGDSTVDFMVFCFTRQKRLFLHLPAVGWHALVFALRGIEKTQFKERLFSVFRSVKDIDGMIADFWKTHERKLKRWYLNQRRDDDVIISASPEFLLSPVCAKLGVTLIASRVDRHTGHFTGQNCYGAEKVARFRERFGDAAIESFYSDSRSDDPLARLAAESYLVSGDRRSKW